VFGRRAGAFAEVIVGAGISGGMKRGFLLVINDTANVGGNDFTSGSP